MRSNILIILIQDLEYADDMVIMSDSVDSLEEVLRSMTDICSSVGLSISSKKTKKMVVHHSISFCATLFLFVPHPNMSN